MTKQTSGIRLWPGIVAAVLIVIGYFVQFTMPQTDFGFVGSGVAMLGGLLALVWWLFFSRARWSHRLGATALLIAAWFATRPLLDMSILSGGMGALPFIAIPTFALALIVWVLTTREQSNGFRVVSLVAAMAIAAGLCTLVRTSGIARGGFDFHWRWTPTPEEQLLARGDDEPAPIPPAPVVAEPIKEAAAPKANADTVTTPSPAPTPGKPAEWPGFRGPYRDGVVRDLRIDTDWSKSPPTELWRKPIGPGWSSFSVDGDLLFTQEQRGNDEIVASYRLSTGQPVWRHRDAARFWESNAGAGPRGTPAIHDGRIYALGATGLLNALDEKTGTAVWSRNAASDMKTEIPMWGFSSSPLIADNVVIASAGPSLAGYDIASGKPRWVISKEGFSYSSPHPVTIDGVPQVLMLTQPGVISVTPSDGKVLWEHVWEGGAIVQPAVMTDGNILINSIAMTGGQGIRRLAVALKSGQWAVEERWTSSGLKPYFNDFVVHNGYAFGFDGSILSCVDLADGKRKWKGGRYGAGQVVLLADQDLLLVLSDDGELALVSAKPEEFKELAHFKALEGKTWNHPVVVHDTVIVRNGEEMAAFKLSLAH